ncbi:MAG TPA: hypothetical protein VFE41_07740 [Acetobacteraceae bacterium]|nr:hypothetical protein [Acetobacteraceae bacterium]
MTAALISGDIQMLRTDGNSELRYFDQVIRFLHRPTLFLVAAVFIGALALGLALVSARSATAQTGDGTRPCIIEHRFEPGPIVNGHHRQPTFGEIEARTRELWARSKTGSGAC